jgi:hypothetical protein
MLFFIRHQPHYMESSTFTVIDGTRMHKLTFFCYSKNWSIDDLQGESKCISILHQHIAFTV